MYSSPPTQLRAQYVLYIPSDVPVVIKCKLALV